MQTIQTRDHSWQHLWLVAVVRVIASASDHLKRALAAVLGGGAETRHVSLQHIDGFVRMQTVQVERCLQALVALAEDGGGGALMLLFHHRLQFASFGRQRARCCFVAAQIGVRGRVKQSIALHGCLCCSLPVLRVGGGNSVARLHPRYIGRRSDRRRRASDERRCDEERGCGWHRCVRPFALQSLPRLFVTTPCRYERLSHGRRWHVRKRRL
mmetsp:Transcript_6407/g.11095  ORF Transcript_6407/g.11095 Transcript_6407/m.11095 type:complete len:212 (-) Transcript_6407:887-1522(-)